MPKTVIFFLLLFQASVIQALPLHNEPEAPEALAQWRGWVLQGYEEQYLCPLDEDGEPKCVWPVTLSLNLHSQGGDWSLAVEMKKEGALPLPGGPGAWPGEVRLESGESLAVLGRETPLVWLPAGRHLLSGRFSWPSLPETIDLPLGFVLDLKVEGRSLDFPAMDLDYQREQARLWLKGRENALEKNLEKAPETAAAVDRLTVGINRLVRDSQPMMIHSRLKLVVSGQDREVLLTNALLPGTQATYLSSPLPAQLTAAGLRVKVKPGVYEIFLDSRSLGRSESLGPVPESPAEPEFWAFEAQPQLRQAAVSGAEQIDPSQADIYGPWRNYPIYMLEPGQSLVFDTLSRGDPEPPPNQLHLARECWLDYDGGGLSCRDRLSGSLSRQWHLNTSAPFSLSQASLGQEPQVITWQTDSKGQKAPGIQLREGRIDLRADLRIDGFKGLLPASGWDQKLESGPQKLNLPPGYRLFHASGADVRDGAGRYSGSGTWTGAWGTLDFFVILIISIAVWKLYAPKWGFLALLALVFCYQEALAPRMVFLHLLACAALLRILPIEYRKMRFLIRTWRLGAALTLVIISALFLIDQVQMTLYPQLENPRQSYNRSLLERGLSGLGAGRAYHEPAEAYSGVMAADEAPMVQADMLMMESAPSATASKLAAPRRKQPKALPASPAEKPFANFSQNSNQMVRLSQAPDAKVQNSSPRPDWNWRSVSLIYNGSVLAEQEVKLYLVGPALGRLWGLARIALICLFSLLMLDFRRPAASGLKKPRTGAPAAAPLCLGLLLTLGLASPALAQGIFPDQEMLEQYRQRLLERKDVPPPGVAELRLKAEPERLRLEFSIEAAAESIFPLPTLDREIFRLDELSLSGRDLPVLDEEGRWLVLLPEGRNRLVLSGRLRKNAAKAFQISFPPDCRPQYTHLESGSAWLVEGLESDGRMPGSALYLTASGLADEAPPPETSEGEAPADLTLAPFFLVQRTISLGLEWQVHTSVSRITPLGAPVSLKLPLLAGENPISGGFKSDGQSLTLNFGPQVQELNWSSSLELGPELTLKAEDGPWSESWQLDVSPIWRVGHQGLSPIHNTSNGFWQPQWRPWPGEALTLKIDRPEPVPGRYLVIDRGQLSVNVAESSQYAQLNFRVRGSQGGPFSFKVPAGVEVKELKVDGRSVPLAPGRSAAEAAPTLTAPLSPGSHDIEVSWVKDEPLGSVVRTPALDLGLPTANLSLSLNLPENRWIIWTWGPLQGPAVQFWPLVAVILLAAWLLGRYGSTPLGWASWFLLGLGLMQLHIIWAMVVAAWLLIMGRRSRKNLKGVIGFNLAQLGLLLWTGLALLLIYQGIKYGLLQNPVMLISGGNSYGQHLSWFVDRSDGPWPVGGVLSFSVWLYKALMLAWSLWLAVSLVKWLKWAWQAFSHEAIWKKRPPKAPKTAAAASPEAPQADSLIAADKKSGE